MTPAKAGCMCSSSSCKFMKYQGALEGLGVTVGSASSSSGALMAMLTIQTVINTVGFTVIDPAALPNALRAWRPAVLVGLFSLLGSIGWAWALTLENAAKVRTLGQVELVIAFAIAYVRLGERHARSDYAASALVLTGVMTVTLLG